MLALAVCPAVLFLCSVDRSSNVNSSALQVLYKYIVHVHFTKAVI